MKKQYTATENPTKIRLFSDFRNKSGTSY